MGNCHATDLSDQKSTFGLSDREIKIIKKSWSKLGRPEEIGKRIFHRIFQQEPNLKKSFHLDHLALHELDTSARFIGHAQNFGQFLHLAASLIDNADGRQTVMQRTREFGSRHAELAAFDAAMFDPEYWMFFITAAVTEICTSVPLLKRVPGARSAWQLLLTRLVLEMKISFYKELFLIHKNGEVNSNGPVFMANGTKKRDSNLSLMK